MKYYEFKYKSKAMKSAETNTFRLINLFTPALFSLFIIMILSYTPLSKQVWYTKLNLTILIISLIVGIFFVIRFNRKPKGIFLFPDHIDIDRQYITKYHMYKMNYTLMISEISYCQIEKNNVENHGIRSLNSMGGIGSEFVYIRMNDGKSYCFCIENQEDFVNNVNELMHK